MGFSSLFSTRFAPRNSAAVRTAIGGAAIFLGVAWVYGPAIHGTWLWDDHLELTDNPMLRDPLGWLRCWSSPAGFDYLPFKDSFEWLEWSLWGGNVAGYHAVNLALHCSSALLLWRLLAKLAVPVPWLGGLLLAIHPLAVESVAWISELKNTLSLPFYLLAALAYVDFDTRARDKSRRVWPPYVFSLAAYALALLSKSSVVMFPATLLVYLWWRRGTIERSRFLSVLPFLLFAAATAAVTIWFQAHRGLAGLTPPSTPLGNKFTTGSLAVAFYAALAVVPLGLSPIYPARLAAAINWSTGLAWLLLALLLFRESRRTESTARSIAFAGGAFVLNLIPILGFVPMAYTAIAPVADHFAYLALVAAASLAAAGLGRWLRAQNRRPGLAELAALVICLLFAGIARAHARHFRSAEALWTYAVERNPNSWIAQNNLGIIAAERADWPAAHRRFESALSSKPDYAEAQHNLARVLLHQGVAAAVAGDWAGAVELLEQAVRLAPSDADAHVRYSLALWHLGKTDAALAEREIAFRLDPSLPR